LPRTAHLDQPVGDWPAAVTVGLDRGGRRIAPGAPADLVLFRMGQYSELLSRPQTDRVVLRAGLPIGTSPPDYHELDGAFKGGPWVISAGKWPA
jgi:cytosine/creatinine deaminase